MALARQHDRLLSLTLEQPGGQRQPKLESVCLIPYSNAGMIFLEKIAYPDRMAEWSFLTNHARALLCIAHDPGARLRDIAATLEITERRAFGILADLTAAGYVVKVRDGRRNRYHIQHHLPLPEAIARQRTIGEVLELLTGTTATEAR